jgi:SHS2 domain-containing protein
LEAADYESLLVGFLSELLYLGESEGLGVERIEVVIQDTHLSARLACSPLIEQRKEIKAVTYHNLNVIHSEDGFQVTIVFDV